MAVTEVSSQKDIAAGLWWMVISGLAFVAVTGIVRHLGSDLPATQAAFIRYSLGLMLLVPFLIRHFREIRIDSVLGIHAIRGLVHSVAVMLWFYAMARIPIAEVTAIGYVAPIFTTLGAAVFFGEVLHMRRIMAIVFGFIGMLIILRPGVEVIQFGSLAQFMAAPLFAISFLLTKRLTRTENPTMIVAMLSVFCTIGLIPGAVWNWRTPTLTELSWLLLTAIFATFGHYALTRAFRLAPISVTQPVLFLQLVWAAMLGYLMFGEEPDPFVLAGGALIVGAASYIAHREHVAAKKESNVSVKGNY